MAIRLPADIQGLVVSHLVGHASITALAGTNVFVGRARDVFPQVVISVFGGRDVTELPVVHLDETYFQVDCWGAHQDQNYRDTWLLARTVRAVFNELPDSTSTRGVVTKVRTITPPLDYDDPNRARVRAEYGVTHHPLPL